MNQSVCVYNRKRRSLCIQLSSFFGFLNFKNDFVLFCFMGCVQWMSQININIPFFDNNDDDRQNLNEILWVNNNKNPENIPKLNLNLNCQLQYFFWRWWWLQKFEFSNFYPEQKTLFIYPENNLGRITVASQLPNKKKYIFRNRF